MATTQTLSKQAKVYGQTIAIKYFLNKLLKPRTIRRDGKEYDAYPLYVRVAAKRQTTVLKSVLDSYVIPEFFEDFLARNADTLNNEQAIIRARVLRFNPFGDDRFSMTSALHNFDAMEHDIRVIIGSLLWKEFEAAFVHDRVWRAKNGYPIATRGVEKEPEKSLEELAYWWGTEASLLFGHKYNHNTNISVFAAEIAYDADEHHPETLKLWNEYGQEIWKLSNYCDYIGNKLNYRIITINDWLAGKFDDLFTDAGFDRKSLDSLHGAFAKLRAKYSMDIEISYLD